MKPNYDYHPVFCPRDEDKLCGEVTDIEKAEHFYSGLKELLLKAPEFRRGALTLCCAVPVKHFLPENALDLVEYLDLVFLRGKDVIMAVKVARPDLGLPSSEQLMQDFRNTLLLSALPLFILDSKDFMDLNDPEPVINLVMLAGQVESLLTQQLYSNRPCVKAPFQQIPAELFSALTLPRLKVLSLDDEQSWFPTEFGRRLGIMQAFQTDKNNLLQSLLYCAEEDLNALQEVVSCGEKPTSIQTQENDNASDDDDDEADDDESNDDDEYDGGKEKLCPLAYPQLPCQKDECALYKEGRGCAIAYIANRLIYIADRLSTMYNTSTIVSHAGVLVKTNTPTFVDTRDEADDDDDEYDDDDNEYDDDDDEYDDDDDEYDDDDDSDDNDFTNKS